MKKLMTVTVLTAVLTTSAFAQPGGGNGQGMGQGWRGGRGQGNGQGMGKGMRQGWRGGMGGPNAKCPMDGANNTSGAARPLTPAARQALLDALTGPAGEYQAHTLYGAIVQKHGAVQPYVALQQAESHHIAALSRQLEKYGVAVPANAWTSKIKAPANLAQAAQSAAQDEEKNAALYDKLLAQVKEYPDLTHVFGNLQSVSRQAHLPMLRAAAQSKGQLSAAQMQGPNGFCCGRCLMAPFSGQAAPSK